MRQRLISKAAPQAPLFNAVGIQGNNTVISDGISLQTLLFDSSVSKADWMEGLKYHSKTLTNLLLNDQKSAFNQYLNIQFGSQGLHIIDPLVKDGLIATDYRPILQDLLQTAILIEHSTIPPYLTALYSIKDGTNALASQIIRSVAIEEMLHMIMVCNVMNAVSIQPSVNRPQNYPSYPMKLPMNVDFYVSLEAFSMNSIATFIAIESPGKPLVKAPKYDFSTEATNPVCKKRIKSASEPVDA